MQCWTQRSIAHPISSPRLGLPAHLFKIAQVSAYRSQSFAGRSDIPKSSFSIVSGTMGRSKKKVVVSTTVNPSKEPIMTHAAVAKVAETGGSKVLEVADIQVDPAKPAAGEAELAAPKKKKRSYANAYVRKGQGLTAAINEVRKEKDRLLDQADAAALLTTNTPSQQTPSLPDQISIDTVEEALGIKQEGGGAVQQITGPISDGQNGIKIEQTESGPVRVYSKGFSVADLAPHLLAKGPPVKRRQKLKKKVKDEPEAEKAVVENVKQKPLGESPTAEVPDLGFGLTKKGKRRKRPAPKAKSEPQLALKSEPDSKPDPSKLQKAEDDASQKPDLGLTKAGKPRKRAAPKAKSFPDPVLKSESLEDSKASVRKAESGTEIAPDAVKAPKRKRKGKSVKLEDGVEGQGKPAGEKAEGEDPPKKKRRGPDPNAFKIPTPDILEEAVKFEPGPPPVPNLGFACLNATLRAQKPPMFTSRGCVKKTFEEKGIDHISELALENAKSLSGLILWNHLNGIRFFRMSSEIFPWCSEWDFEDLKDKEEIRAAFKFAGELARAYGQRLTFHPSHFVKLGCEEGPLLDKSIKEMEQHSLIIDLLGFEPSPWNKINIHIGGMYGDKEMTLDRFAKNYERLSPNLQKRLTVENDDRPNSYSLRELMRLHELTGIPLVFDFHHHKFCDGGWSEEEAFKKALSTWPEGVRPVVHWSESQDGRRPSAHSDFVTGPLTLYGLDDKVDVMIEAKAKELALLRLRDPTYVPGAAALALVYAGG